VEAECWLPCSQETATGSYSGPDEPNPQPNTLLLWIHFKIILEFTVYFHNTNVIIKVVQMLHIVHYYFIMHCKCTVLEKFSPKS
jgi:hypothetical protein